MAISSLGQKTPPPNSGITHSERAHDSPGELDQVDRPTPPDATSFGEKIPNPVGWLYSWTKLVYDLRHLPNKAFWELFGGSARATAGLREAGWSCGQPIDVADGEAFILRDPCFLALVIALIWEGLIALLWLGPPCSSFSMAVNRSWEHAMRSMQFPVVSHG